MVDVMGIDKTRAATAGEAAATVSALQGPPDGRWNGPGFTPNVEDIPLCIFMPVHNRAVTSEAQGSLLGCWRGRGRDGWMAGCQYKT